MVPRRNMRPIWTPPRGRFSNNLWQVYSPKVDRVVNLYSDLEYDHWVLVESDPHIRLFCEQPRKIVVVVAGKSVSSVFDMWIERVGGEEEYREVKYAADVARFSRQIGAQRAWCERAGVGYAVVTEREIRNRPQYLANWKLLLRYLTPAFQTGARSVVDRVLLLVDASEWPVTLSAVESAFPDVEPSLVKAAVATLLHSGAFVADLERGPITPDLPLEVAR